MKRDSRSAPRERISASRPPKPEFRFAKHGSRFYIVYVLYSLKDRKLYIGYTTDLDRRLGEHERGESPSTAPRRPLRLLFCEHYISKEDATRREQYFKTTAGKRALKLMLKDSLARAAAWPTPTDEQS